MKILLVRHGETDWNVAQRIQGSTDIPLNENGLAQAEELAHTLENRNTPIIGVYTSKLQRAAQTAQCVADMLGVPCHVLPGLEEINFGLWEGITWEQVAERFPDDLKRWKENRRYEQPPHGESYQELLVRVVEALQKRIAQLEESGQNIGDIVVVTHSADIMTILSFVNDTPFYEMVKRYKTANTGVVEIEASVIMALKPEER